MLGSFCQDWAPPSVTRIRIDRKEKKRKEKKRKEKKRKEKKRKEKKRKEKKREDYMSWCQFAEKASIVLGCPVIQNTLSNGKLATIT